jgi:phosphate transport system permease protein
MKFRWIIDRLAGKSMYLTVIAVNSILFIILISLFLKAYPILIQKTAVDLFLSTSWHPMKNEFGFYSFIIGTLEVTFMAMFIATPLSIFSAIYLSEYAGKRLKEIIVLVIDLLAAIPSVVYGLIGVILIVPSVKIMGQSIGYNTTGYCLLSGGIILAIMVLPVIISISVEVLNSIPFEAREASIALGATKWETIKYVLIKQGMGGMFAAIILGFTRALGETMAVLMVTGNVSNISLSIFDPVYTLPGLIANNYGEMMSIPLYSSALMLASLILFFVVAIFSIFARIILAKIEKV